jgi:YidC/Oxa1 family membrane protein insertase
VKEMSDQVRVAIAAVLSLLVIVAYSLIVKPPKPPQTPDQSTTTSVVANTPVAPAAGHATSAGPTTTSAAAPSAAPITVPVLSAPAEKSVVVESGFYRVEFWNRGGVVQSWQLKNYIDDNQPPHTLDVVHTDAARMEDAWPFSVVLSDPQQQEAANSGLYVITSNGAPAGDTIKAPAQIELTWSDGHLEVRKVLKFAAGYEMSGELSVKLDGKPIPASLAWRGGFGNLVVRTGMMSRGVLPVQVLYSQAGKLTTLPVQRVGQSKQPLVPSTIDGPLDYAGIEDQYFAAVFLPPAPAAGTAVTAAPQLDLTDWAVNLNVQQADKVVPQPNAEMAAGTGTAGPFDFRLFVGPKSLDELKAVQPPLDDILQFGWFTILSEPIFYALRWIHRYVPNWGWAVIVFTLAINMLFYPLKIKSMRAAQKMQKAAPEIKAIQEKYKKYGMRDPRKAKMNEEVMAVYSREGINPLGSCWPMLLQLPFWWAFYRVLYYSIELRHAAWIFWIRDLSAPDPFYILPILAGVTMIITTRMTPTPTTDPGQKRMLMIMPLMFCFWLIYYPSGLALYILVGNFVATAQQWYLNRTMPMAVKSSRGWAGKKS